MVAAKGITPWLLDLLVAFVARCRNIACSGKRAKIFCPVIENVIKMHF